MKFEGTVEIMVWTPTGSLLVNRVGEHEILGETGMFGDLPRSTTAVAKSRVEALRVPSDLFRGMFHSSPAKSNNAQASSRNMQYLKVNKVPMLFQSYREAFALTLKKHPEANASWTEGGMLRHHNVDIGVAVAIEYLAAPVAARGGRD